MVRVKSNLDLHWCNFMRSQVLEPKIFACVILRSINGSRQVGNGAKGYHKRYWSQESEVPTCLQTQKEWSSPSLEEK